MSRFDKLGSELPTPDRPRLMPRWLPPLACAILAACVWPEILKWYGLAAFCVAATALLIEVIEARRE